MKKFLLPLSLLASPVLAQQVTTPNQVALVCAYNSSIPSPVSGQYFFVQCDSSGKLITTGGGGGTPGGSNGQLQYNNSGAFGGTSGWTTDGANALTGGAGTTLALGGATIGPNALAVTGNITQTAASGTIFAGDGAATPTIGTPGFAFASATGVGFRRDSTSRIVFTASGADIWASAASNIVMRSNGIYGWASSSDPTTSSDTILSRAAAASIQLGAADAASPVAQTLGVQSVVAGTSNTAGANWTIKGSAGTGTGAGGSIIFQVAPAGSTGTSQNASATALTIDSTKLATSSGGFAVGPNQDWKDGGGINVLRAGSGSVVVQNSQGFGVGSNIGFLFGNASTASMTFDGGISRLGAASIAIGNGTNGDFSGGLKLTDLTINRAATFLTTSVALTNGAGASAGTITNAPSVGNPTKWIGINDNGTTRYIPAW